MKKKVIVSAPGKLMLFGEHAVVYNRPCLVTAVDQRMKAEVEVLEQPVFQLEAKDVSVTGYKKPMSELGKGDIPKGAKFAEIAVRSFLTRHSEFISGSSKLKGKMLKQVQHDNIGIRIITKSDFSSQFGFGSSSAVTVCVIKALSELFDKKLTDKQIFHLAYKTVLDVQGKGSGFDIAAAIFGGTLYFVTGGKVIEPLAVSYLPLVVGYSGIKADTVTLVNQVKEKADKYPEIVKSIYDTIEKIVNQAKIFIEKNDWQSVGELMNVNQGLLAALGVSSNKLEAMIYAAREAGAYGTKLSGAGGGDCMIAITPEMRRKEVEKAIIKEGGEIIRVLTNAEGVKIE